MLLFFVVNFSVMFTDFGHIHSVKWITLKNLTFFQWLPKTIKPLINSTFLTPLTPFKQTTDRHKNWERERERERERATVYIFNQSHTKSKKPDQRIIPMERKFWTKFLEWQPCHSSVMVLCSSRAIYLGFCQWHFSNMLVVLSPTSFCS